MKATIWIKTGDIYHPQKCIFNGEIQILPRVGDYIYFQEHFPCERVSNITIDLLNNSVSIFIDRVDLGNDYQDCLKTKKVWPEN